MTDNIIEDLTTTTKTKIGEFVDECIHDQSIRDTLRGGVNDLVDELVINITDELDTQHVDKMRQIVIDHNKAIKRQAKENEEWIKKSDDQLRQLDQIVREKRM